MRSDLKTLKRKLTYDAFDVLRNIEGLKLLVGENIHPTEHQQLLPFQSGFPMVQFKVTTVEFDPVKEKNTEHIRFILEFYTYQWIANQADASSLIGYGNEPGLYDITGEICAGFYKPTKGSGLNSNIYYYCMPISISDSEPIEIRQQIYSTEILAYDVRRRVSTLS